MWCRQCLDVEDDPYFKSSTGPLGKPNTDKIDLLNQVTIRWLGKKYEYWKYTIKLMEMDRHS